MSFIKISNPSKGVNRVFLEKLGLSTKRDDENTIGQFGSGSKFAPIAALRKNIRWVSAGTDEKGPYTMEFISKDEDGINCVYSLWNDGTEKPTSFTLEAGMLSWEDDFQIFREAFANALDEKIAYDVEYTVELADEIKIEEGIFSVYLSAVPEMLEIFNKFDKYFCIDRSPLMSTYSAKMFDPYDKDINCYLKGILVYDGGNREDNYPAIFNYEFRQLLLNEERRVRWENDINSKIIDVWSTLYSDTESHMDIARRIINQMNMNKYETQQIPTNLVHEWTFPNAGSAIQAAWEEIYGKDACAYHSDEKDMKDQIPLRNMKPIQVKSDFMISVLRSCGVPTLQEIIDKEVEYDLFDLNDYQQKMFDEAIQLVRDYCEYDLKMVNSFSFFHPKPKQQNVWGVAHMDKKDIYLSDKAFFDLSRLVGTIIHEIDHIKHVYGKHDEVFRHFADERIGDLIVDRQKKKMKEHTLHVNGYMDSTSNISGGNLVSGISGC